MTKSRDILAEEPGDHSLIADGLYGDHSLIPIMNTYCLS